jgi:hypothetical protein
MSELSVNNYPMTADPLNEAKSEWKKSSSEFRPAEPLAEVKDFFDKNPPPGQSKNEKTLTGIEGEKTSFTPQSQKPLSIAPPGWDRRKAWDGLYNR